MVVATSKERLLPMVVAVASENSDENDFQIQGDCKPDLRSTGLICDVVGAQRRIAV